MEKQVDILIVGAGISGIGLAAHLSKNCPKRSFEIIERRESVGGTWDLFKYPGIRSDSDMSTFGYNFKPWTQDSILADGASIKNYLSEVIAEYQLKSKIHFQHRVLSANYDSQTQKWSVVIENAQGKKQTWIANFVLGCTGYYNYDQGFQPDFPNQSAFKGTFIHPQHWPENFDYSGKKVVIIGSGATAITLVLPAMAGDAAHVTMLQRSPTYVATVPAQDLISEGLRRFLPEMVVYRMARTRNILLQRAVFNFSIRRPKAMRRLLLAAARRQLGPRFDMRHFQPRYNPWEERMCAVPRAAARSRRHRAHAPHRPPSSPSPTRSAACSRPCTPGSSSTRSIPASETGSRLWRLSASRNWSERCASCARPTRF